MPMFYVDQGVRLSCVEVPAERAEALRALGVAQPSRMERFRVAEVSLSVRRGPRVSIGTKPLSGFLDGPTALRALRQTLDEEAARFERYAKLSSIAEFQARRLKRSVQGGRAPHAYLLIEGEAIGQHKIIDVDGYERDINLGRLRRIVFEAPRVEVQAAGISLVS